MRTWSIETGNKVFEFKATDGNDEMSCMSLEVSGRRLFTGSRTGMVYVRRMFKILKIISVYSCCNTVHIF